MMSNRRNILLGLLVLPIGAGIAALAWPGLGTQLAFLVLGVPVLALNAWEFFMPGGLGPERTDRLEPSGNEDMEKGSVMKRGNWWIGLVVAVVLIGLVLGFLGLRAYYTDVPFLWEIYHVSFLVAYKAWTLILKPAVFIAILVVLLILLLRKQVFMLFRGRGEQPFSSGPVSESFHMPGSEPATARLFKRGNASPWVGDWIDMKTAQLLLEIDGIDISKAYLFSKLKALELFDEELPADADPARREAYYRGVLEGFCEYVLPSLCDVDTWDNARAARFTLKKGTREKLLTRLHDAREAQVEAGGATKANDAVAEKSE